MAAHEKQALAENSGPQSKRRRPVRHEKTALQKKGSLAYKSWHC